MAAGASLHVLISDDHALKTSRYRVNLLSNTLSVVDSCIIECVREILCLVVCFLSIIEISV